MAQATASADIVARIAKMEKDGQIERVPCNAEHVGRLIAESDQHFASAAVLAERGDITAAFSLAYDAARKAMSAACAAMGVRIKSRGGHWAARVLLCVAYPDIADTFEEQEWLQAVRNRAEYPDVDDPQITESELREALAVVPQILRTAKFATARPISW